MKKLSIIIVSWNCRDLLRKCLVSLEEYHPDNDWEVIVVDNNSQDGTKELLDVYDSKMEFKVLLFDENLGFARGNNMGLDYVRSEYVLFLNPDTEIIDNSLQKMIDFMDENPQIAAIGPKLLNSDKTIQRSVRKFPTLFSQILVLLKLHNFVPRLPTLKKYFQLDFDYNKTQEVDQVMGAALMIRKNILDKVSSFDEGYKRIFEEVDLCFRVKKAGFKLYYFADAQIIHHKGASFSKVRIVQKQLDFNQGMIRFFRKHKGYFSTFIIIVFSVISIVLATVQAVLAKIGDPIRKRFKKKDL